MILHYEQTTHLYILVEEHELAGSILDKEWLKEIKLKERTGSDQLPKVIHIFKNSNHDVST